MTKSHQTLRGFILILQLVRWDSLCNLTLDLSGEEQLKNTMVPGSGYPLSCHDYQSRKHLRCWQKHWHGWHWETLCVFLGCICLDKLRHRCLKIPLEPNAATLEGSCLVWLSPPLPKLTLHVNCLLMKECTIYPSSRVNDVQCACKPIWFWVLNNDKTMKILDGIDHIV